MNKAIGCLGVLIVLAIAGSIMQSCDASREQSRRDALSPEARAREDSLESQAARVRALQQRASLTVAMGKAKVREVLKDPESARFGEVWAAGDSQYVACGYVNARNSFGGYTGEELFVATVGGAFLKSQLDEARGEARKTARMLLATCDTTIRFSRP